MAVDEALLESAHGEDLTLRFYQWSPATLSLGYFQHYEARATHAASLECPIVRRASGGGAILHDRELTYSLVVPVSCRFSSAAGELYTLMHRTLVAVLAKQGVEASLHVDPPGERSPAHQFLCFERRTAGDVVSAGYKIAGSAQRRHQGAVLQHGSVLLGQSPFAPELPGIAELSRVTISAQVLQNVWLAEITAALAMASVPSSLTETELRAARTIAGGKFSTRAWTQRR